MSVIKKCVCNHSFQDKQYGSKMRVMNNLKKSGTRNQVRCTVCSKVYDG